MNKLNSIILLISLFLSITGAWAFRPCDEELLTPYPYDTRSDSIDLVHFTINLNITDFTNKVLTGYTEIRFTPLVNNIQQIRLDLMTLMVDSVIWVSDGSSLGFNQVSEALNISFPSTQNISDTNNFRVYYHGVPSHDPTFGGFYFQSGFAYSVGVSLSDIPHNYGRTWFPCFDNFTERSSYDFIITTQDIHTAVCGGLLINSINNGNGTSTHSWHISQQIPSYLPSVAVNNFAFLQDTVMSITNQVIPIILAARPSDTTNVKNSFIHLKNAFHIFEYRFGPYRWDRIGYCIVPMTAGAMEHAMNIAYPIILANGSTSYQDIMAHELSHHWFGNLITCRTAEDMWINEGSAAYCEYIFNELLNGPATYRTMVRNSHKSLLQTAHIDDNGYWPLSGMPQDYTYGVTTYTKGADVLHTLRSYLGDAAFFNGLSQLLTQNAFDDVDADEYRDDLSAITGYNLSDYFDTWIFQGGWPHFAIDSIQVSPSGMNYDVQVHLRQKLVGRANYGNNVPFTLNLRDAQWNLYETTITTGGNTDVVNLTVPILPVFYALNLDEKISHAVTAENRTINTTGTYNLSHANMTLNVSAVADSVYFLVEHNWAPADPMINTTAQIQVSPQRYWRVDGLWNSSFMTSATVAYNGRTTGSNSHLDHLLITGTEDSLVLLYRPGPGYDWTEYGDYTLNTGPNHTDKAGSVIINTLIKGEYTLGYRGGLTGIEENTAQLMQVYPNPTLNTWRITLKSENLQNPSFRIYDSRGKMVSAYSNIQGNDFLIDGSNYPAGIYFLCLYNRGQLIANHKIIKQE